jgi:1-acyl-sn-glycerol-3-phosphate acyltransferase
VSEDPIVPELPIAAPRTGGPFTRWLGRCVLKLGGWRVVGRLPNETRLLILAAPHSSGWDAVWGLAAKLALGVRIEFMAKRELFWWPLGALLRALGAFPIDRSAASGVVQQMAERLRRESPLWLLLAPEGTRRRVDKWKSGFWHIARAANVPVHCAYFHYPSREIGLGATFTMTDDLDADMARVRAYYAQWQGKHRGAT